MGYQKAATHHFCLTCGGSLMVTMMKVVDCEKEGADFRKCEFLSLEPSQERETPPYSVLAKYKLGHGNTWLRRRNELPRVRKCLISFKCI